MTRLEDDWRVGGEFSRLTEGLPFWRREGAADGHLKREVTDARGIFAQRVSAWAKRLCHVATVTTVTFPVDGSISQAAAVAPVHRRARSSTSSEARTTLA